MDQLGLAGRDRTRIRAALDYLAEDLVAQHVGQRHAAVAHVEAPGGAEIEIAVADMQIGVADPAARHLDENFGSGRLRDFLLDHFQRLPEIGDFPTTHLHGPVSSC